MRGRNLVIGTGVVLAVLSLIGGLAMTGQPRATPDAIADPELTGIVANWPRPYDPASPVWGNRAEWAASVYAASSFVAARSSYPQPAERKLLSYWLRIQCIDQ